ncbi:MAG: hypothetical protein OXE76_15295 [Alphaproteobacteria bacterium]|nr:hypothetical protein [Alphaproteobacteria bacterium]MCY4320506.1 hypothetical protein [Alphaproteobacteria bacterium]
MLIACASSCPCERVRKLGRIPVLKARMNADLHMTDDLKNTGKVEPHVTETWALKDTPKAIHRLTERRWQVAVTL